MTSTRKRLLKLWLTPKRKAQIVVDETERALSHFNRMDRPSFDYHRYIFFSNYGPSRARMAYQWGDVSAQRAKEEIAYHRALRAKFTTRLP